MNVALCGRQLAGASLILCSSAVNIYWCDGGGWPSFWEAEDAGGDGQLERTCMGWAGHCLLLFFTNNNAGGNPVLMSD